MQMFFAESFLARAVYTRSIRVHGWQPGSQNPGSTIFRKNVLFLKFIGLVKPLWVLYSSEIMYRDSTGSSLVRAVFARSIKVLGWQPGAPKTREHGFPKKILIFFFEIHRTSDNSIGSVALRNHAYGLYGTSTSQSSVCKVN